MTYKDLIEQELTVKFKKMFDEVFCEEKILKSFEYKKLCASQSYYLFYTSYKILVLLKKDELKDNKRHWVSDELIGNSLNQLVIYYEGNLTEKEIYDSLMLNFENNYVRFLKDVKQYNKFISKEDIEENKVKSIAEYVYKSFSSWIVKNKNYLKNLSNTFEFKQKFYNEYINKS